MVPNGSEVMCQQPPLGKVYSEFVSILAIAGDCGDPGEQTNGMVNGTRDGSVITFQGCLSWVIGCHRSDRTVDSAATGCEVCHRI